MDVLTLIFIGFAVLALSTAYPGLERELEYLEKEVHELEGDDQSDSIVPLDRRVRKCPDGWSPHGDSCYFFSHDKETFLDASYMCKYMGGELVEIESSYENSYLYNRAHGTSWIGLNDIQEKRIYRWFGSNSKAGYTNWDQGQPNNYRGEEYCVGLAAGRLGKWHDYACSLFMQYICEK